MSLHSGVTKEPGSLSRRALLARSGRLGVGLATLTAAGPLLATEPAAEPKSEQGTEPAPLSVAYAGSMASVMEGPVKEAAARSLRLELRGQGQGASALAQLIVGGSLTPDVFVSVTPGPMGLVLKAGKAATAVPVAATRMVIAYSPHGRFRAHFDAAREGKMEWWRVLETPGLRFGRTDPGTDPQGRNIIFTMMLAAKKYGQPDLVERVLGPMLNPRQISLETSVPSRLQSGELDAASAYRIQPGAFHLPFLNLPHDVDLSGSAVHTRNPEIELTVGGKTFVPEPLVYYAAALRNAKNPAGAEAFLRWLGGPEAQRLLRAGDYDAPEGAPPLHA